MKMVVAMLFVCGMALAESKPAARPTAPGQYKLFFDSTIDKKPSKRPYYLSLPEDRRLASPAGKLPMVVFLHGICEGGDDHQALFIEAIPLYCRDNKDFKKANPFIFLCPQAVANAHWETDDHAKFVIDLIEKIIKEHPVDPDRVYLTGLSNGGTGTWRVAMDRPDLFAGIAVVSGRAWQIEKIARLKNVPAWLIVGGDDGDFVTAAQKMLEAHKSVGGRSQLKIVPRMQHVIWDEAYLDPALYKWFLQQKRRK